MFEFDAILNAFFTLLVTIDPVGLVPIFIGVTVGMTSSERLSVAIRACSIAFGLLVLFLVAGQIILDTLGITIHAFRVAGGLLLFYIAFEMVFGVRQERKEEASKTAITKDHIANIAVFPLALPMIAGPGAISATILLSTQFDAAWEWRGILVLVIGFVISLVLLAFIASELLNKYLGNTGRMILTRLLGVLLAALSVQFVIDGVKALVI